MNNKKENTEKKMIDGIVDYPKKNLLDDKRINLIIFVIIVFFIGLYFAPVNRKTVIASMVGSILSSSIILLLTLSNEKQEQALNARKSANILAESLSYIENQITQIDNGSRQLIYYPSNWLGYYTNCSMFLKYDYLNVLSKEFSYVTKVNKNIQDKNEIELKRLIDNMKNLLINSTTSFNIFSVRLNLSLFAQGEVEMRPWNQTEKYLKFSDYFYVNYKNTIGDLTVDYLKIHGKSDVTEVQKFIMTELRKNSKLENGKYSIYVSENRAMLNEIFKVFLSLNKSTSINLIWGKLSLKEKE